MFLCSENYVKPNIIGFKKPSCGDKRNHENNGMIANST